MPACRKSLSARLGLTICLSALTLASLSGCSIAEKFTPQEQALLDSLDGGNYYARTAEEREAVETQPLFAQAAFWSQEYDKNPSDLEAAIKLSSALRRLGNPQKAAEIAQTTRSIHPRNTELIAEYAANLIALELGKDAIAPLSTAVRQDNHNPRLWSLLGAANDQIGQYKQAREYYNRALGLSPNDSNILANVGLSYALEGDAATAEVWLRRAALDPNASANVRQNLAIILGLQGKYDEAENLARQDLQADGAENNLAYLKSLSGGQRSYGALAGDGAASASPTPAPTPSYRPTAAQNSQHNSQLQNSASVMSSAPMANHTANRRNLPIAPSYSSHSSLGPSSLDQSSMRQPTTARTSSNAVAAAPAPTSAYEPRIYGQMSSPQTTSTPTQLTQPRQPSSAQTRPSHIESSAMTTPQQANTEILNKIHNSVTTKERQARELSYREMEAAYQKEMQLRHMQAQQQYQAQMQAQYQAQYGQAAAAQGPSQAFIGQAYPTQSYPAQNLAAPNGLNAAHTQQAQSYASQNIQQGYPQRRMALRSRN